MESSLLALLVAAVVGAECAIRGGGAGGNSVLDIIAESIGRNHQKNSAHGDESVILELSKMDTPDFIKYYGYKCETHEVTTEDGYILHVHHIPHGINGSIDENRPVVLLQHGIFSYSGDWFIGGPQKSLGFLLADAGYDVWVGNSRGNKYSRAHTRLDPDRDLQFWDFSWHEFGRYDLPATIDYLLNYTQEAKLFYIGHSQGTTAYYVLLSERPEYNGKIHAQYSLAPEAYMTNLYGSILKHMRTLENVIDLGEDIFKIHELNTETPLFKFFTKKLCSIKSFKKFCINEIFALTGYDYPQFNTSLLPIMVGNFPAGASLKQLKHYAQEITSGEFQQYDYGYEQNEQHYGSYFPPKYNLTNVRAPIHLIYSFNDYLASPKDVERLFADLPEGSKHKWPVANKQWNHIDYIYGIDAKTFVYDYIFESMGSVLKTSD